MISEKIMSEIYALLPEYFTRDIALFEEIELLLLDLHNSLPLGEESKEIKNNIIELSNMIHPTRFNNGLAQRLKLIELASNISASLLFFKLEEVN